MALQSYKELKVWQRAMVLVAEIYKITSRFPKEELYGLSSQLRRAAVSVPSNLAEGATRRSTREFIRFVMMARGSLAEMETQVIIAFNLNYLPDAAFQALTAEIEDIGRMIYGLEGALNEKLQTTNR